MLAYRIICLVCLTSIIGCQSTEPEFTRLYYVRFSLTLPSGFYVDTNYVFEERHLQRIYAVCQYRGIESWVDTNYHTLMIPTSLAKDTELVVNLINRASDTQWLRQNLKIELENEQPVRDTSVSITPIDLLRYPEFLFARSSPLQPGILRDGKYRTIFDALSGRDVACGGERCFIVDADSGRGRLSYEISGPVIEQTTRQSMVPINLFIVYFDGRICLLDYSRYTRLLVDLDNRVAFCFNRIDEDGFTDDLDYTIDLIYILDEFLMPRFSLESSERWDDYDYERSYASQFFYRWSTLTSCSEGYFQGYEWKQILSLQYKDLISLARGYHPLIGCKGSYTDDQYFSRVPLWIRR